jgi:WD40 repeat protein
LGNHDQIPRLLAHFEEEQEFYLVQQFIEGNDLKQELPFGKPLGEIQVIALCQEILKILEFVHQQGVIHRDIKPANIIRRKQDGKLVLIDFGAVKQVSAQKTNSESHTTLTVAIGSPGYMPNEQLSGKPRFCSDIYAVGMLAIQALTGISPRQLPEDPNTSEIIWRDKLLRHTLDEPLSINSELADILEKMVRYDHRQRYQKATEVLQALQQLCDRMSTATVPIAQFPTTELPNASESTMPLPVPSQAPVSEPGTTQEPIAPTQAPPSGQQPVLNVTANLSESYIGSQTAELAVSKSRRKSRPLIKISAGFVTAIALTIGIYYYQGSRISASERQWVKQVFLAKTLAGDSNYVNPIAIAPDSKTLATGREDGAIKLWNLQTGTLKTTLKGHLSAVSTLALSRDGKTLASGSADETIKVWNLSTGQPIRTLSGKSKGIKTVAISPDSQTLASGDAVGTIEIWNLSNGERLNTFPGHQIWVTSLAISQDGQTLVSSSTDKTIKLWELTTGALVKTLTSTNSKPVTSVAISPNGQTIASGDAGGTIQLWDLHSGKATKTLASGLSGINSLAFRAKGQILASGSGDGIIRLWDLRAGKLVRNLSAHSDSVNALSVSPDGRILVSSSQDKTIRIWRSR